LDVTCIDSSCIWRRRTCK